MNEVPNKPLALAIIVAFAGGMLWPWLVTRRSNAPAAAVEQPAAQLPLHVTRTTTPATAPAAVPQTPLEPTIHEPQALPERATANDAVPGMESPAPPANAHFVAGTIAYLRCDGVPQRPGPYPCPRTEAFENLVFARLAHLSSCSDLAGASGQGDLALTFTGSTMTNVSFRDRFPSTVRRLPPDKVLSCVGQQLADVTLDTRATRSVVSFRFALAP